MQVFGCSPEDDTCGAKSIAWEEYQTSPALPFRTQEEVLCIAEETYKVFIPTPLPHYSIRMREGEALFGHIEKIYPKGIHVPEFWDQKRIVEIFCTVYIPLQGNLIVDASQLKLTIYTDQEWELVYDTNDIIISGTSEEPRLYTFTITESTTLSLRRLDTVDTIPLPAGITAYWSVYPVDDIQGIVPEGLTSPVLLERTYQYIEVDDPAEYTFQISLYDGSDVSYQHNDMLLYFVPKHYASRKETLLPSDVKALAYHALAEYGTLYPPLFATDPDYSVIPFQLIDTITKNGLSVFELQAIAKYYYLQFDDYVVPIKKVSKLMATTYPCVYHENGKAYVYVPEQYQNFKWIIGLGSDTA